MPNRGSAYIITLACAVVLMAAVMGFSYRLLLFRQAAKNTHDTEQAYIYAELALRHALYIPQNVNDWRNILPNGIWLDNITIGPATYTVSGLDLEDGDLSDNQADPVTLRAAATVNGVTRTLQVVIQQGTSHLLDYATASGNNTQLFHQTRIRGDCFSNQNLLIDGNNPGILGNVNVVLNVNRPNRISGTVTTGVESRTIPNWQAVSPFYLDWATQVPYHQNFNSIYLTGFFNNVLAPVNPNGLYLIDCQNRDIFINNAYIWGTLILLNPGPNSQIRGNIVWIPTRSDFPALLINGNMTFSINGYIRGLVYADGNLTLQNQSQFLGNLIATGQIDLQGSSYIYWSKLGNTRGFVNDKINTTAGTFREVFPNDL